MQSSEGFLLAGTDEAKSIRELIQKSESESKPARDKSPVIILQISNVKDNLVKATRDSVFSRNLTEMLKEPVNVALRAPILGIEASEAIADPNINVIDSHVAQLISDNSVKARQFQPNLDEIRNFAKQKHRENNLHNLYRENLQIAAIHEEVNFKVGAGVEQWKVLTVMGKTALIGRTSNSIVMAMGHNDSYEVVKTLEFDVPPKSLFLIETIKVWDTNQSRERNFVLVALQSQLVWHEILANDLPELHRWNLLKEITSMIHFKHEGSEVILVTTVDEAGKVQAEFIEFNVPDSEFWVIQAFTLPAPSPSMICLDFGRDVIVAFVQDGRVIVYRHQFTTHLRGKFSLFKTIEAANVSSVSGFRIGGHSYLAIGGDQPQILRYFNDDFHLETILSQSFGFVEGFLPIPIRTYRDDLVLLVQHRLDLGTHSIAVVDGLVWNGIAFESALSVPCRISADPAANGFTCMLDLERDEGLLGAAFVHHERENRLQVIVPRREAHSGMFRLQYEIVDAEDPLLKEMEHVRKSIELINQMLDFETLVEKEVEEALKVAVNPKNDFNFEDLPFVQEIFADVLEFDGNIVLNSDAIEFLDSRWTHGDFQVDLDALEKTIAADEEKLRMIDEELNKLNRINRQTSTEPQKDSKVFDIGSFTFNGQLRPKTIQIPADPSRVPRQIKPVEETRVPGLKAKNIDVETINGIPVGDLIFLDNGQLLVPDANITFVESIVVEDVIMMDGGRVNGVDFSHEILAVESPNAPKNLIFENVFVQNLEVVTLNKVPVDLEMLQKIDVPTDIHPNLTAVNAAMLNNVNVETINGIKWDEFVAQLVPKHKSSSISELTVEGDVWILGELNVGALNGLSFPDGYVLKNGPRQTTITGKKTFAGSLSKFQTFRSKVLIKIFLSVTNAIDTEGTIDNIEPSNMITLDQSQRIPAETTFKVLEVMQKLEVNGTISGKQLDAFLPNPTLQHTREVSAACNFKELIVQGSVAVEETLNGQNLAATLADVVYETPDGTEVIITAAKTFKNLEVQGDVDVSSSFINDMNLENFLMTDREQTATIEKLRGDIFFTNLKIAGLFDGINATELEHNSVRTFGDQFIETPIIISEGNRVEATSAGITKILNEIPVGDFLLLNQPMNLAGAQDLIFNDLQVENLKLDGDVVGAGTFASLNLTDLMTNHLSKTRPQVILAPARVKSLTTNGTFHSDTINGKDFEVFKRYMRSIRNFESLILSGDQRLSSLIVDGNVNVMTINDKNFDQIVMNAIWLNRPNTIDGNVRFLDDVVVGDTLTVQENINKKPFKKWLEGWISSKDKSIVIQANKIFASDVFVEDGLKAEVVNRIHFEDLLMVGDVVRVPSINVYGNVIATTLAVDGKFNGKPAKFLSDVYSYDGATYTHIVNHDVHFSQKTSVGELTTPILNQMNVTTWMADLIRLNDDHVYITGEKTFTKQLAAVQGFFSDTINDLTMDFLDRVVLVNDQSIVNIDGDVAFVDDVYSQLVGLKGDLSTRFISGCDPKEWIRFALPINRDVLLNGKELHQLPLRPSYFLLFRRSAGGFEFVEG